MYGMGGAKKHCLFCVLGSKKGGTMAYNSLRQCLNEKVCPVCNKLFYPYISEEWAYQFRNKQGNTVYSCSYTCHKISKERSKCYVAKPKNKIDSVKE